MCSELKRKTLKNETKFATRPKKTSTTLKHYDELVSYWLSCQYLPKNCSLQYFIV